MKKFCFFFFVFTLFFLSCSQDTKEINNCDFQVILEYKDSNSLPSGRFSFFTELSYDPRKVQSIELQDTQSDFKWKTSDVIQIQTSDKKMIGYTNFVLPKNYFFENSLYLIILNNFDGTSQTNHISLNYNKELLNMTQLECEHFLEQSQTKNNIAIFDKENKLIYYGEQTENLQTPRDIYLKYNQASYYNQIKILDSMKIMCKMPTIQVESGENNE